MYICIMKDIEKVAFLIISTILAIITFSYFSMRKERKYKAKTFLGSPETDAVNLYGDLQSISGDFQRAKNKIADYAS